MKQMLMTVTQPKMHQPKLPMLVNSMSSNLNVKENVHEAVVRECGAGVNHVEASNIT